MTNVLLVATGSVAAIRSGLIAELLHSEGHNVRLVYTNAAKSFLTAERPLPSWLHSFDDASEWRKWQKLGDPVLHIELRNWASVLVFAPLDANSLAKLANGLCDNLATCIARAWPLGEKPFIVAPAMNTAMWNHPVTSIHIDKLKRWGIDVIEPIRKTLACGETGVGAMEGHNEIVGRICDVLRDNERTKVNGL